MPSRQPKSNSSKKVENFSHEESRRTHIPTAEFQSVMAEEEKRPIRVAYERRNRDLDPQLVWRGKDEQDWSDLVVDRKSTRLNSSHRNTSRMPSSA